MTVEVHLANGLPSFTLVGLADTEVKESRERVRAALQTSGLEFPHNKRVTVNLAPADLPKESGRFDLPIALGILAAAGQIDAARLDGFEFAGELSLGGELRPVHGALAMALALRRAPAPTPRTLVLPQASADESALVGGLEVRGAAHLLDVVRALLPGEAADDTGLRPPRPLPQRSPTVGADLVDVRGQAAAKRALEIAAAGQLSVLMIGPPGTGKSMLARRLAGLLPPLSHEDALESAAILSVAGAFSAARWGERVLRAPHHTASAAALVGGGSPPRPGEASLAHHGILFLDELPEFPRAALEALREPLETGRIVVSRAARQADFPAAFQLVAAMNPCPCGQLGNAAKACRCTPDAVLRYQGRISGPLLDRIDIQIEVPAVPASQLAAVADGEPSAVVAARVAAARRRALDRQGTVNGLLAGSELDRHCRLDDTASHFLQMATTRLGWSARSFHRVLRVARTVADLEGSAHDLASRRGDPVPARARPGLSSTRRRLEQRRERALGGGDAARAALGPALQLVGADAADVEVARFGMGEVEAGDARRRQHRQALGQRHADLVAAEGAKEIALDGVVGARRIARRRPDAAIALGDEVGGGERLVGGVAPEVGAHALVQPLGEGLGEPVGQRLQHDRAVVVEVGGELLLLLVDAEAGGHREEADVVALARAFGRDEIGEAAVRPLDAVDDRPHALHAQAAPGEEHLAAAIRRRRSRCRRRRRSPPDRGRRRRWRAASALRSRGAACACRRRAGAAPTRRRSRR